MKNKTKNLLALGVMTVLSVTAISASIGLSVKHDEPVEDKVLVDDKKDDIGTKLAFPVAKTDPSAVSVVKADLGVQLLTGEGGANSLRFIAALSNYDGLASASFTRTMTGEDGTVVKETSTLPVNAVYTSFVESENAKWINALDTENYKYYMVYTMRNIPSAHNFSVLDVTFSAQPVTGDPITATQRANVQGVIGGNSKGATYTQMADADTYWARVDSGVTEVTIDANIITIEEGSYVASKGGKVVSLGEPTSTTGGAENRSSLTKIDLPDSLEMFNKWCFSGASSLKELELPRDLKSILASAFNSTDALKTIYWNAVNLTTVSATVPHDIDTVYVSSAVEAFPSQFIGSSYKVQTVYYEGTTAEWEALIAGKESIFNAVNVICSDTVIHNVTFHLNGGTLTGYEETAIVEIIEGKTVASIGRPSKSGLFFKGWYTAPEGGEAYDFATPVTGALDLYAQYQEAPEGSSFEKPAKINTDNYSGVAETNEDMNIYHIEFTAPETDVYYLAIDSAYLADGTTKSNYPRLAAYDASGADITESVQVFLPERDATLLGDEEDYFRIKATKGEVYRFGIMPSRETKWNSTTQVNEYIYSPGTANFSITSAAHDTIETALPITAIGDNTLQEIAWGNRNAPVVFTYTATETKEQYLRYEVTGGSHRVGIEVYDVDNLSANPTRFYSYDSVGKLVSMTAGKTYAIYVSAEGKLPADGITAKVGLGDIPAGYNKDNPITMEVGTGNLQIGVDNKLAWYNLSVAETTTYRITLDGGSTSYAKIISIYGADATTLVKKAEEAGEEDWYGDIAYGTEVILDVTLEAGDYYVAMGYNGGSQSAYAPAITLDVMIPQPGDFISTAIPAEWVDNTLTLHGYGTTKGTYYKFTPDATAAWNLTADSGTLTVYDVATEKKIGTIGTSATKYELTAGTEYAIHVVTDAEADVVITREEYVGPFSNYPDLIGEFGGTRQGSSYYRMNITVDGLLYDGGKTPLACSDITVDSVTGYTSFNVTGTSSYHPEKVVMNADYMWLIDENNPYCFFVGRNTDGSTSSGPQGQVAKTSDFDAVNGVGVMILSIATRSGGRDYAIMVDGVIHLGVTVEFSSGTNIETGTYVVKGSDGTEIGTYTSSNETITL